eukprot:TRINITY_DN10285_c0_g1_i1.p2 TRINITY_DN10285_c0_g1~~TRINITY_DN10285_c0_g1_i1.p2  ORF type:complete len:227 (+),score=24.65 TRINITY_DN10285_c0_g1_i1:1677-2357(+)
MDNEMRALSAEINLRSEDRWHRLLTPLSFTVTQMRALLYDLYDCKPPSGTKKQGVAEALRVFMSDDPAILPRFDFMACPEQNNPLHQCSWAVCKLPERSVQDFRPGREAKSWHKDYNETMSAEYERERQKRQLAPTTLPPVVSMVNGILTLIQPMVTSSSLPTMTATSMVSSPFPMATATAMVTSSSLPTMTATSMVSSPFPTATVTPNPPLSTAVTRFAIDPVSH